MSQRWVARGSISRVDRNRRDLREPSDFDVLGMTRRNAIRTIPTNPIVLIFSVSLRRFDMLSHIKTYLFPKKNF